MAPQALLLAASALLIDVSIAVSTSHPTATKDVPVARDVYSCVDMSMFPGYWTLTGICGHVRCLVSDSVVNDQIVSYDMWHRVSTQTLRMTSQTMREIMLRV